MRGVVRILVKDCVCVSPYFFYCARCSQDLVPWSLDFRNRVRNTKLVFRFQVQSAT